MSVVGVLSNYRTPEVKLIMKDENESKAKAYKEINGAKSALSLISGSIPVTTPIGRYLYRSANHYMTQMPPITYCHAPQRRLGQRVEVVICAPSRLREGPPTS